MTIESRPVMGGAPRRGGDGSHSCRCCAAGEDRAEVKVPWTLALSWLSAAHHDFGTNFIAGPANAYAQMHYDVQWTSVRSSTQLLDPALENPGSCAAPAGVEQRDPLPGRDDVDRNAVGDGHQEQDTGSIGEMPIGAVENDPAPHGTVPGQLGPVYLVRHGEAGEAPVRVPELPPARHDVR